MAPEHVEEVPTTMLSAERCHLGEGPTYDATTDAKARRRPEPDVKLAG